MTSQDIPWRARERALALWLITVLLSIVVLVVRLPFSGQVTLVVGDVAATDVVAQRQITYVSDILTQQRRDLAANAMPDVYDPIQARIGRQQLTVASQLLDFIGTVRSDPYADLPTKATYLHALKGVDLPPEVISRTLALSGPAWDRVADETQVVLERAMREEIRDNTVTDERRKVPARVRLDLSDEDAAIVTAIVEDLLVPNSFFNAEKTEQRRQQARERVEPATTNVERNEVILRAGDIVSPLDIEALEALGLRQTTWSWEDVRAVAAFVLLLALVLLYYLWRQEPQLWLTRHEPFILALGVLTFLISAKALVPGHTLFPYLFPYAALPMLLAILINQRVALATASLFVLVIGWLTGGSVELMTYTLVGSLLGTLKLRRGERLASFAWAAAYVMSANLAIVGVFRLAAGKWDPRGLAELAAMALSNGLVTLTVTLVGIYLVGAVLGIVTPLQLIEISRPTHPLLRQLLLKASGTYHHTLIVSNMAERAAEAIGADALLTRVGAYYHDVGKTIRPYFFIENRTESADPHARLDPYTSSQIIISHVRDGIELARKYRLPQRIIDFIPEHHGTLLAAYFYHQAVKQAGSPDEVDKVQFRYPGPRPRTRETAITMLADGAEATVRSKRPASIEEMEQIVAESIQNRMLSGQLDDCPLTLADLQGIRKAFVDVLRGLHHPRITYPTEILPTAAAALDADALGSSAGVAPPPKELTAPPKERPGEAKPAKERSGATRAF
ncbi:MAG: HDIG domain-containing protein [Chloroflexi bacterium]|nr:HDIG domain-containing protein [Chloroflexota bacterium]